jgi:hypothetical protein
MQLTVKIHHNVLDVVVLTMSRIVLKLVIQSRSAATVEVLTQPIMVDALE